LDEVPFHLVAARQDGREGEDEDILDRIFYSGVPGLVDLLHEVHAIVQSDQVMLERKAFGLVGQRLDAAEEGGSGGGDFLL
jgi:hypothetical protein